MVKFWKKMPYKEAKNYLMKNFHGGGVGDKVADCTLLFFINKFEVFPIDVWIKRIMEKFYFESRQTDKKRIRAFAIDHFGKICRICTAISILLWEGERDKITILKDDKHRN